MVIYQELLPCPFIEQPDIVHPCRTHTGTSDGHTWTGYEDERGDDQQDQPVSCRDAGVRQCDRSCAIADVAFSHSDEQAVRRFGRA